MGDFVTDRRWQAVVWREGNAWNGTLLDDDGHELTGGGTTWARSLATLRVSLGEVAVLRFDLPDSDDARISAALELRLRGTGADEVAAAVDARAAAAERERELATRTTAAVKVLADSGVSDRDAGQLLGLSFQRIAQLRPVAGAGTARAARGQGTR